MSRLDELFWNSSVEDMKRGYVCASKNEQYVCLMCGKVFHQGVIYRDGDVLVDARKAVKNHIGGEHGSVFAHLLGLNKKHTGLTDVQRQMLAHFYAGLGDKQIVERQERGSTSTIRSHRFKLRQKDRQAKVSLAMMGLLDEQNRENEREFAEVHKGATMLDELYAITEKERKKVLENYFAADKKLKVFPSKEKRKIIILTQV